MPRKICFDPGHGGHDPGAIGRTPEGREIREKNVVLPVCLSAMGILAGYGVETFATREEDVFVSLSQRAQIANNRKAAFFLSVHCNSAENRNARGIETFIHNRTTIARPWGEAVQNQMVAAFPDLPNRGLKSANFLVLRETRMPAALAELGFLSNPQEAAHLAEPSIQEMYANALALAAVEILGITLRREEPTAIPESPRPHQDEVAELAEIAASLSDRIAALHRSISS